VSPQKPGRFTVENSRGFIHFLLSRRFSNAGVCKELSGFLEHYTLSIGFVKFGNESNKSSAMVRHAELIRQALPNDSAIIAEIQSSLFYIATNKNVCQNGS